jgi:hypothetical protein
MPRPNIAHDLKRSLRRLERRISVEKNLVRRANLEGSRQRQVAVLDAFEAQRAASRRARKSW